MRFLPFLAFPVVALSLTACSATSATPAPVKISSAETPAFATDEKALAAAEAAYAEYLQVSDQIAREGGANPERLMQFVTQGQYQQELQNASELASNGIYLQGDSAFDSFHVANPNQSNLSVYICVDVSNTKLLDAMGGDVTPVARESRWPLLVSFTFDKSGNALISGSETWTGQNFC